MLMNGIKWMKYYHIVVIHLIYINRILDFILFKKDQEFHFFFRLSSDEEALRTRIHVKLKEIMLQVNLDEVTPKFVIAFCFFFN